MISSDFVDIIEIKKTLEVRYVGRARCLERYCNDPPFVTTLGDNLDEGIEPTSVEVETRQSPSDGDQCP